MAKCPSCGEELSLSVKFCPNCGSPLRRRRRPPRALLALPAALVLLALLLLLFPPRRSVNQVQDELSVYTAVRATVDSRDVDCSELWAGGFSIELQPNHACVLRAEGKAASASWTLTEDAVHLIGGGFNCDGTLRDGVLTLRPRKANISSIVFLREGAVLPPEETPAQANILLDPSMLGTYSAESVDLGGVALPTEAMWYGPLTVTLGEDWRCSVALGAQSYDGRWTRNGWELTLEGDRFSLHATLRGEVLCLDSLMAVDGMSAELDKVQEISTP